MVFSKIPFSPFTAPLGGRYEITITFLTISYELLQKNHYISDHFVTAPYASYDITMLQLLLNDGFV